MGKKKDVSRLRSSFGKIKNTHFNFDLIEKYFRKKNHQQQLQAISDKTCSDLDFDELFMVLDRTSSKVGQQYLYNKLRSVPTKAKRTEQDELLIEKLSKDSNLRIDTQLQLEKLNKNYAYHISSLFQDDHIQPPKWFIVIPLLSLLSLIIIFFCFIYPRLILVSLGLIIINFVIHYWNKNNLNHYLASFPQLIILNTIAQRLLKNIDFKAVNSEISHSTKTLNQLRKRMLIFQLEANMQGEFEAIFWNLLEIIKAIFLLEPLLLFGLLKRLDSRRSEIENIFEFVGHIDCLISIASFRHGLNYYCTPTILEDGKGIFAEEIYHPLIMEPVSNSINLSQKSMLLTGSNMSGKTSFIRTVGINILLGLTINTCLGRSMKFSRMKIHSAIRISDDLLNDKSYYFAEVQAVKEMLATSQSSTSNLFLLDEIFKGTNTIERISAGKAVLSELGKGKNFVLVSTHDIELTDLLSEEYELYHFSEALNNKHVDFDYQLKPGKLKKRNAIRILEINGYPESVINEAIEIAKQLDHQSN